MQEWSSEWSSWGECESITTRQRLVHGKAVTESAVCKEQPLTAFDVYERRVKKGN